MAHLVLQVWGLPVSTVIQVVAPTRTWVPAAGCWLITWPGLMHACCSVTVGISPAAKSLDGSVLCVAFDVGHGDRSERDGAIDS